MRLWYNIVLMSAQSRILFIAVLASLTLISGCKKDYYDLDMVPEGDTLHRTLVVEPDEEALAALEALYGHAPILIAGETPGETSGGKPPAKYKFEGSFKMLTPNDIGGSGYLLYCDSIMGSASMYSEQFRGDDDLAAALERQEIAINGLFDIFILWLESEFADSPNFPVLRKAIDENLRSDFWNLSL